MGNAAIFVRLLGEGVDCWRPVDAVDEGEARYRIIGPEPDPSEQWEFHVGEMVHCRLRDGQLTAVQLVRPRSTVNDLARPLSLQSGRTDVRRQVLAETVGHAIDAADPIGLLASGAPADEYSAEIGTILPRLSAANGVDDVLVIVHEEFTRWFDSDTAGPRQAYEGLALRIWEAVHEYRYAG